MGFEGLVDEDCEAGTGVGLRALFGFGRAHNAILTERLGLTDARFGLEECQS